MKTYLTAYIATLIAFVAIDFVWLSTMADRLYRPTLGEILAPQFRLAPALAFYLIYAAGLTFLAVRTGLISRSMTTAVLHGAVIGLTAYATYDLTNQSTLKNWSLLLTIADLIWGTVLSAAASGFGFWLTQRIFGVARL
ncbi:MULTISPECIES: DUF2177 family protein [unclassified Rhizobium]|jgi:uncharacterized membrane protein|uniref:DUF2177 family protein n=1 Tax=unclassified Rhizobium TaxID=2613769 RepID=UPI000DBAAC39|nr:DUF2177 family protein [Rhizobium sp. AN80A]